MQPWQKDHNIFLTQVQMIKPEINVWGWTSWFVYNLFENWIQLFYEDTQNVSLAFAEVTKNWFRLFFFSSFGTYVGMEDISYSREIMHYAIISKCG